MKDFIDERVPTGVENLDLLLKGGIPQGSVMVFGGSPGTGKTILSQQICFHNATPQRPAVIFSTLSEPAPKTIRYLRPFAFFDEKKVGKSVHFVDLGDILRKKGLSSALEMFMENLRRLKPAYVVIDSFKAFDDLAASPEDLRKFIYEVIINLMAWECTAFLLGEFEREELMRTPVASIVDGILLMTAREEAGEDQRFIQVHKLRGTAHDRNAYPLQISREGIEVFAPRAVVRREERGVGDVKRCRLGMAGIDALMPRGIPFGSSLLVAGAAGTGKSLFALEALYRGAKDFNQKGLHFTFEETPDRVLAAADGMGWDLEREIKRGRVRMVYVPQPEILVEQHLLMMRREVEAFKAKRVVIDSTSIFLHKIERSAAAREKLYQLATIVQRAQAIGLFVTDIAFGSGRVSRFGVEDAVVDGIILLSAVEEGLVRRRYIEIYKMRNTKHHSGRLLMEIAEGGLVIEPPGPAGSSSSR